MRAAWAFAFALLVLPLPPGVGATAPCDLGVPTAVETTPQDTRLEPRATLVSARFYGLDPTCAVGAYEMRINGERVDATLRSIRGALEVSTVLQLEDGSYLPGAYHVEVDLAHACCGASDVSVAWSFNLLVPEPGKPYHEAQAPTWLIQGFVAGPVFLASVSVYAYDVWLDPFAPTTGAGSEVARAYLRVDQGVGVFVGSTPALTRAESVERRETLALP